MPKGKTRKPKKPDPVEVRFHLRVRPDLAAELTEERYNEIFREWVLTGRLPDGYVVPPGGVEWRNPARRSPALRQWRTGDNQEAVATLLRRLLPAIHLSLVEVPQQKRRYTPAPKSRRPRKGAKKHR